jgi:hypothetical protein
MPWFALVSKHASVAIDLYRSREQAERELVEIVEDEPEWRSILAVVEVDLPEPSAN